MLALVHQNRFVRLMLVFIASVSMVGPSESVIVLFLEHYTVSAFPCVISTHLLYVGFLHNCSDGQSIVFWLRCSRPPSCDGDATRCRALVSSVGRLQSLSVGLQNVMTFNRCSIDGKAYGDLSDRGGNSVEISEVSSNCVACCVVFTVGTVGG